MIFLKIVRSLTISLMITSWADASLEPHQEHSHKSILSQEQGLLPVRHHSPASYRGHNQVFQTAQDERGVIYITNYGAVLAFDGHAWERIPVPGASFLYGLAALGDGSLAVCGVGVVGLLQHGGKGEWEYTDLTRYLSPEAMARVGEVWDLYATPQGVFIFTRTQMLRWHEGILDTWSIETEKMIYGFWTGSSIYIQKLDHGLFRLDGDEIVLVSEANLFQRPGPRAMWDVEGGKVLVATMSQGLWIWDGSSLEPLPTEADTFLKENIINRGLLLSDGRLALGTFQGGVAILSSEGTFEAVLSQETGLPSEGIQHLFEDREGGLWCSLVSGISRVEVASALTYFDRSLGLPALSVAWIERFHDTLFLGSNLGLFRLKAAAAPELARWEMVPEVKGEMHGFWKHEEGLFMGVQGRVLFWDGSSWDTVWDSGGLVRSIAGSPRRPDRVYVGGRIGVGAIARTSEGWQALSILEEARDDYVQSIVEDPDGSLWVGTVFSGLLQIPAGEELDRWKTGLQVRRIGEAEGLPVRDHLMVRQQEDGLHVYSPEGSFRWNKEEARFEPAKDKLAQPTPLPGWSWDIVVTDKNGTRWGLIFPDGSELDDFQTYFGFLGKAENGEDSFWSWIPPGIFDPLEGVLYLYLESGDEEILWVGGWNGLMRWNLHRAPRGVDSKTPNVSIRKIYHEEEGRLFSGAGMPREFTLPHSRRELRMQAAAPVFAHGLRPFYRSRLTGYENRWSEWTSSGERIFTNLPHGRYRLEVEARTELEDSKRPAIVDFVIVPPWYLSFWAYAGYAAVAGLLFWGGTRWRLEASHRENQRLEALVAERTVKLKENEIELRAARDTAEAANRAKSAFLANMSHELRTPLNSIMGYAQILTRDVRLEEDTLRKIHTIQSSSQHLLHLINEVLDLSKIESGRIEVNPTSNNLENICRRLEDAFQPKAREKNLQIRVSVSPEIPTELLLDGRKVEQILFNLLGNAIKFTESGGIVIEAAQPDSGWIELSVRDTGTGIAKEKLEEIFEPFQQLNHSRAHEPGTGLGLAIARRLAEAMGGSLYCQSEVGQGSRFVYRFPSLSGAGSTDKKPNQNRQVIGYEGSRQRILVVDDLVENRSVVRDLLTPYGFLINECQDGPSSLQLLEKTSVDLVLLDLRMAPLSGSETLQHIRREPWGKALPIVAYSASAFDFRKEDASRLGFDGWLPKPFLLEDLLKILQELLPLQWIYSSTQPPAAKGGSLFSIPADRLRILRALTHRREPAGLRRELESLARDYPDTQPTVEHLLRLVAGFRLAEVSCFLEGRTTMGRKTHSS